MSAWGRRAEGLSTPLLTDACVRNAATLECEYKTTSLVVEFGILASWVGMTCLEGREQMPAHERNNFV